MEWVMILIACAGSAGLAVWLLSPRLALSAGVNQAQPTPESNDVVFLFDGDTLIDISDAACGYLPADKQVIDWSSLCSALATQFPTFPKNPDDIREKGHVIVPSDSRGHACSLLCEWVDGTVRVQLCTDKVKTIPEGSSGELGFLRETLDAAPYPIWRVGDTGAVTWSNLAYARLVRRIHGLRADPLSPIFPKIAPEKRPGRKSRVSIAAEVHDKRLWYDVSVVKQKSGNLCFAVDINAVVDAEVAQRNFVQTLAKTFAQLSIGLAIFDRNRQLALFNPALIDLTALPADFLSGRPNLLTFFDRMRDGRMMPEPKNYGSWRDQIAELVAAAADGRYQETWSLPSGSVYSVSGRPHPDGAVAFLFEDITAEITLTRRFRSELELGQAVMDQLDDAIAVFAPDGTLAFSNRAYNTLWNTDPDRSFAQITVLDTTRTWQNHCLATPAWGEIRDFVTARENRAEWWVEVQTRTGACLTCSVHPVQSGATMVRFSQSARAPNAITPAEPDRLTMIEPETEPVAR